MHAASRIATAFRAVPLALALACAGGCASYQLGSMLPADIRTVHVPTFQNATQEPLLEIDVTNATIQEFQTDGTLGIAGAGAADAILEATITGFELRPLRYERDEPSRASEYRLRLSASVVLKKRASQKLVVQAPSVIGETWFVPGADLVAAKRTALPDAARQLAHNIVEQIVEAW